VLRDSRILSVVEKWSSEELLPPPGDEHPATATDVTENVELDQDQEASSGTETRDENNGSDGDVAKPTEASARDDDAEIHQPSVSNQSTVVCGVFLLHTSIYYILCYLSYIIYAFTT